MKKAQEYLNKIKEEKVARVEVEAQKYQEIETCKKLADLYNNLWNLLLLVKLLSNLTF